MYDLHPEMNDFYASHVRLSQAKRNELAGLRDLNLQRLNEGLALLGEDDDRTYGEPVDHCDQGSYPMHTLNQNPTDEYDIDEAIIFRQVDLPADPCDARQHIVRAFRRLGIPFKKDPERRTNAVTIWYAEGYHVDFAVYRFSRDGVGAEITEHAGPEWKPRNPRAITAWFDRLVQTRSPSQALGATVEAGQFRKVVRLLKVFTRSRVDWDLPGGMIISKLVEECYRAHPTRDDVALYDTAQRIRDRLGSSLEVCDPLYPNQQLTDKDRHLKQVERLREELMEALDHLAVLEQADCTRTQAMDAWHWFFNHDFWLEDSESGGEATKVAAPLLVGRSVREARPFA